MNKPYIICSAVWFTDNKKYEHQPKNVEVGFVICGRRHHNCYTTLMQINNEERMKDSEGNLIPSVQGFLTSEDMFVTRIQAGHIAYTSKQIDKLTDCLMSEDLY